jgi:putative DNA primase/helicase
MEIGTTPPGAINLDGQIHRYHDPAYDKPGEKNAWYKAIDNGDGTAGGSVGHWRLQLKKNWFTGKARTFTAEERQRHAQEQAERRRREAEERERRHQAAADKARQLWKRARPANPRNEYLTRKGIKPHGARQFGDTLVIDYRHPSGKLSTLQFIKPNGSKRFLADGQTAGCYHRIGLTRPDSVITLVEGFATGATIHEATGYPVAVCGSAGNLKPVALAILEKFPLITIVVCGDADPVGQAKAQEAAEAVNGAAIVPQFPGGRP